AFGQEGPLSHLPGFDYIAQAYVGVTEMIGEPGEAPYFPLVGMGDVNTGVHAAAAIGFALLHREKTGKGQYLDISLLDAYYHCHELNVQLCSATNGETEPTRAGAHHFAVCPLGLFEVAGRYLFIITLDPQWPSLCRAMGQENLIEDSRYRTNVDRVAKQQEVNDIVQAWLNSVGNMDDVLAKLAEHRVPSAPVLSISETINEPHFRERGTIRTVTDPKLGEIDMPGMPLRFSDHECNVHLDAAYLGEYNEAVLKDVLGYSDEHIQTLLGEGVLHADPGT
ncbi:MAG: CaiB/BaiF CoA-transferase family protein, partial [Pseudomonadota bacterium]